MVGERWGTPVIVSVFDVGRPFGKVRKKIGNKNFDELV